MEREYLLLYWQQPAIGLHPESHESSPLPPIFNITFITPYLLLDHLSVLFL
jgi:hypothetical protein